MNASPTPTPAGVTWSWSTALLGLAYAAPAAIVTMADPQRGTTLAIGVLCAAVVGLPPARRMRLIIVLVGALAGLGLFVGSLLGGAPLLGVLLALFVLCVLAATTSTLTRLGPFVLTLALPLVGAGLNISSPSSAVGAGLLILGGSAYAWLISLLWPEVRPAGRRAAPRPVPRRFLLEYGIRLGLTAVITMGVGLLLGIDHPGWATTAALMVGRPSPAVTQQRVVGRAVSVLVGALLALALHLADPSSLVLGIGVAVVLAACTAMAGSRWYVTPAFSSFLVLNMLMVEHPQEASWWFAERVAATLFGVVVAWLLLDLVPALRARRGARASGLAGAAGSAG